MFILNNLWEMCENMQLDAASKRDLSIFFFRGAFTPSPSASLGQNIFQVWGSCSVIYRSIYSCHSATFSSPSTKLNAHSCAFSPAAEYFRSGGSSSSTLWDADGGRGVCRTFQSVAHSSNTSSGGRRCVQSAAADLTAEDGR